MGRLRLYGKAGGSARGYCSDTTPVNQNIDAPRRAKEAGWLERIADEETVAGHGLAIGRIGTVGTIGSAERGQR